VGRQHVANRNGSRSEGSNSLRYHRIPSYCPKANEEMTTNALGDAATNLLGNLIGVKPEIVIIGWYIGPLHQS